MVNFQINGNSIELSSSKKVNTPLLICSHERSGTHFMMNSIAKCTHYTVSPYLNFDYMPLGSFVNFFSEKSVNNFFKTIKTVRLSDSNNSCTNSIIKSHFPLSLLGHAERNLCKIVYIYRNPKDVFISYWKFLHRWDWFEGPKLDSPLDLMKIQPRGQSQRYQMIIALNDSDSGWYGYPGAHKKYGEIGEELGWPGKTKTIRKTCYW